MINVACYCRVSTVGQNEEGQQREIRKWLEGHGITHVRWYIDKESGDTLNRPKFEQLQKDIFNGQIKTIVVWKLDRLSRSLKDGIKVLCDWCDQGIRVVSVTQQIDFNGAAGKLIASVLFAVAEMEQETRRERQAAGIANAKEKGIYKGRAKGATKAGVKPSRALELKEKGMKLEEIANAMKISVSSVQRYLRQTEASL